jgi:hypothetical protein
VTGELHGAMLWMSIGNGVVQTQILSEPRGVRQLFTKEDFDDA